MKNIRLTVFVWRYWLERRRRISVQTLPVDTILFYFVIIIIIFVVRRRTDGRVDGKWPGRRWRRRIAGRLLVATGGPLMVVLMRKIRVRPAAVVLGQRAEIERLLVAGTGRSGDVTRRPPSGQQTTDPVMLLQDHRGGCGYGCLVRRWRVVIVVILAAVVVIVVQVVELVQIPVELVAGWMELWMELWVDLWLVVDSAVLGAGGRGQPEPFSAGHRR